jgi:hypothetical protein
MIIVRCSLNYSWTPSAAPAVQCKSTFRVKFSIQVRRRDTAITSPSHSESLARGLVTVTVMVAGPGPASASLLPARLSHGPSRVSEAQSKPEARPAGGPGCSHGARAGAAGALARCHSQFNPGPGRPGSSSESLSQVASISSLRRRSHWQLTPSRHLEPWYPMISYMI